ncbi:MAG: hypothetical protein IJ787_00895 [Bacilli bacterium]|nr:hypothetical protein [Bacilli bacterium]
MDISRDKEIYVFARLLDSVSSKDEGAVTLLEHWRLTGKLKLAMLLLFGDDSSTLRLPSKFASRGALPYWVALENLLESFAGKFDYALRTIESLSSEEKAVPASEDVANVSALLTHLASFCAIDTQKEPSLERIYEAVANALSMCVKLLPKVQNLRPALVDTNIQSFEQLLEYKESIHLKKKPGNGKPYFVEKK